MTVTVNGEVQVIAPATSVAELLGSLGIPGESVVVELNGEILEKPRYDSVVLKAADRLELVRFVGGG